MVTPGLEIRAFDVDIMTDAERVALNTFENRMKAESWPDAPPTKLERTILDVRASANQKFLSSSSWHIWNSGNDEIVAAAGVWIRSTGSNEHVLERVLEQLPQARLIRTSNVASNEPMLKINHEMGFEPCKSFTAWQIDLPNAQEYLAMRGSSVAVR